MFFGKYLATQLLVFTQNTLFLNNVGAILECGFFFYFVLDYFKYTNTIVVYFSVIYLRQV